MTTSRCLHHTSRECATALESLFTSSPSMHVRCERAHFLYPRNESICAGAQQAQPAPLGKMATPIARFRNPVSTTRARPNDYEEVCQRVSTKGKQREPDMVGAFVAIPASSKRTLGGRAHRAVIREPNDALIELSTQLSSRGCILSCSPLRISRFLYDVAFVL